MKLQLVATCLFGLEKLLGEEIDRMGLKRLETMDGRVIFEGEESDIPRLNICLRCAERVMIRLGAFHAETFDELFEGTKQLPWEDWIGKYDAFPVKGHCIRSRLFSVPDCQSIVKKAVVERLSQAYSKHWFEEDAVKYQIEFFIFKDTASLMIDTTGLTLHKRGYRPDAGEAPLRETLAAAIALTARPREDVLFWDPMCGSGTVAIEAAMILANIAPGLRRQFAGEAFPQIPAKLWSDAREEAEAAIRRDAKFEIYASDIDEAVLDLTYENALRAGVEDYLNIFEADVRKIQKPDRKGTVVCNPPYGERLMTPEEVERLYGEMGSHFADFDPWQIYIITSHPEFERFYGMRADKIRKLYNGMIPCNLYEYFKPAEARKKLPERGYSHSSEEKKDYDERVRERREKGKTYGPRTFDRSQRTYGNRADGDRSQRTYGNRADGDRSQRTYGNRADGDRSQRTYGNRAGGDRSQRTYGNKADGKKKSDRSN